MGSFEKAQGFCYKRKKMRIISITSIINAFFDGKTSLVPIEKKLNRSGGDNAALHPELTIANIENRVSLLDLTQTRIRV